MKKLVGLFIAMVLMALCLTACGCDHVYGDWSIKSDSTCTAEGVEERVCTKCNEAEQRTLAIKDHSWKDATCIAPKTCSVCKATDGILAEHTYKVTNRVNATVSTDGSVTYTCSTCGDYYEKILYAGSAGLQYKPDVTSIGTCTVVGIGSCTDTEIVISKYYNGYKVTGIAAWVFSDCSDLTSVTIPDSVTTIGDGAFDLCRKLTDVVIPDGVTRIGKKTFRGCSLTSIVIPDGVTYIGEEAFRACEKMTSITIPSSVGYIGKWAFYYCSSLTEINFGGTKAQWRDLGDRMNLRSGCTVYCSDGNIKT